MSRDIGIIIDPRINPILATIAQRKISQVRFLELNMSSTLPATTMVGMADRNPEKNRPITTPAREGTTPTITQKMLYKPVLTMYSFLRPNVSEYEGKIIPPMHCPKRYLYNVSDSYLKTRIPHTPKRIEKWPVSVRCHTHAGHGLLLSSRRCELASSIVRECACLLTPAVLIAVLNLYQRGTTILPIGYLTQKGPGR